MGVSSEAAVDPGRGSRSRVLAVVASSGLGGGIERFVTGTLERVAEFCDLEVFSPADKSSLSGVLKKLHFVRHLYRKISKTPYDHVMVFHEDLLPVVGAIRRVNRSRFSLSCVYYGIDIWMSSPVDSFIGRRVKHTPIAISSFSAGAVTARLKSIPFVLPPPIPSRWFEQLRLIGVQRVPRANDLPLRVVSVFRLDAAKQKGARLLVQAVAELVAAGFDVELCLAGKGPAPDWLLTLLADKGWARLVESPSDLELAEVYRSSDVMALCSLDGPGSGNDVEGFGTVLAEASLSGLAVIGPGFGGSTDAILDGVTGLFLNDTSVDCIYSRLRAIAEDRDLVTSFGAKGHHWVAGEFSSEAFRERVSSLLAHLL